MFKYKIRRNKRVVHFPVFSLGLEGEIEIIFEKRQVIMNPIKYERNKQRVTPG